MLNSSSFWSASSQVFRPEDHPLDWLRALPDVLPPVTSDAAFAGIAFVLTVAVPLAAFGVWWFLSRVVSGGADA